MGLRDLNNIKLEYRSLSDNVVENFYIPCLSESWEYDRAVGFFSSKILLKISIGLGAIAKRGGKIKLLVSPQLSKEDYDAIEHGYELRELAMKKMTEAFDENIDFYQKEDRFAMLAYLIEHKILDIKVAIPETYAERALFHEKLGILKDTNGDIISFSGSNNETDAAVTDNYETFDAFCSWKSEESESRCKSKKMRFDSMWNGTEDKLITIEFPEIIKNQILSYSKDGVDYVKLDKDLLQKFKKFNEQKNINGPKIADGINLFNYQTEAIDNWKHNNYRGIFDMATGTGKTFTALGGICELYKHQDRLLVIICCPFIHLVEQWAEEAKLFNIDPIVCYGGTKYKDVLKRKLYRLRRKSENFICVITTNSTFRGEYFQSLLNINLKNTLLIVDEAHHFGADNISECMNIDYPYRLALSATLDRYGDSEGTEKLHNFFGEICIRYDLKEAIAGGKLTQYMYYPEIVTLDEYELDEYYAITKQIIKYKYKKGDKSKMPEGLKRLLIRRARIIAGAEDKITKLKEVIEPYKDKNNLLIYCGAVKYGQYDYQKCEDEKKQVDRVCTMLREEYGMKVRKFTSEESTEEREEIIRQYKNQEIQALVAIKCLDEGINIPSIKTAFILASSTNPKEYIQRRGRVLRMAKGKLYAEIYDFITIPRPLDEANCVPPEFNRVDRGLVQREFIRLKDFSSLSSNSSRSFKIIEEIEEAYDLNQFILGDEII